MFNSMIKWNSPVIAVDYVFWSEGESHTVQIGCCDGDGDGVPDHVSDVVEITV